MGEGVATQKGINAGASMDLDPLAGSFGNAALGFVAGMGPGAVHGAAEGVRHRSMATAPTMEAGDVVHASGKPFITARARQRAEELGGDAQVLRFENGFIVRPGAGAPAQGAGAAPAEAGDAAKAAGTPAQEPGPGGASESAGFQPDQQVCVRQGGREIAVEFVGLERNAATARAGGEPLARIRTPDGRGHFVRLSELYADPQPGNALRPAADVPPALEGPQAFPVLDRPLSARRCRPRRLYRRRRLHGPRNLAHARERARGIRNNNPGNIQKGVGFSGEIEGNDPALPRSPRRRMASARWRSTC